MCSRARETSAIKTCMLSVHVRSTLHGVLSTQASGFWRRAEGNQFPYIPSDTLCNEAKVCMQFSSDYHSHMSDPVEPKVVFGRAGTFKGSEGRIVCSPQAVNFNRAAGILNGKRGMKFIAALGVSVSLRGCVCVHASSLSHGLYIGQNHESCCTLYIASTSLPRAYLASLRLTYSLSQNGINMHACV